MVVVVDRLPFLTEIFDRAVLRLAVSPDLLLIDGLDTVPGIDCEQRPVVDADATLLSVAAASVIAKNSRGVNCRMPAMTELGNTWILVL